jgi:hypothetical protein
MTKVAAALLCAFDVARRVGVGFDFMFNMNV